MALYMLLYLFKFSQCRITKDILFYSVIISILKHRKRAEKVIFLSTKGQDGATTTILMQNRTTPKHSNTTCVSRQSMQSSSAARWKSLDTLRGLVKVQLYSLPLYLGTQRTVGGRPLMLKCLPSKCEHCSSRKSLRPCGHGSVLHERNFILRPTQNLPPLVGLEGRGHMVSGQSLGICWLLCLHLERKVYYKYVFLFYSILFWHYFSFPFSDWITC